MCEAWENFETFRNWATRSGYVIGLEIDRKDNDGDYEPDNCQWVTHADNNQNTRLIKTNNTSGFRGVSFVKQRGNYCVFVQNYRQGTYRKAGFETALQAALARDLHCIRQGLSLPLNFPELALQGPL